MRELDTDDLIHIVDKHTPSIVIPAVLGRQPHTVKQEAIQQQTAAEPLSGKAHALTKKARSRTAPGLLVIITAGYPLPD